MSNQKVYEIISKYLVEQFEIEPEKIKPEALLYEDLGLDSIDAIDMLGMLEAELDMEIAGEEVENIRSMQDVVDFIALKVGDPAALLAK